jgi:O-antigen/teichoic acid export membrane protein
MGLPLLMIILGSGKLIELGTGLNAQILQLSKHWRVDLFTNMFFVGISIILNYFLTKNFGLTGTAIGSVIAIVLFNLIRFIYIKRLLQLQPFTVSNVWALLIAILWGVVCYFIPLDNGELSTYILKSILFIGGFGFTVVRMNLSPDITDLFQQIKNKIVHRS